MASAAVVGSSLSLRSVWEAKSVIGVVDSAIGVVDSIVYQRTLSLIHI